MLRLLFYDLSRGFAGTEGKMRVAAQHAIAAVPPTLRADVGLGDARMADLVDEQVSADRAAQRARDAQRLLHIVNRIAARRGFQRLRWRVKVEP